MPPTDTKPKADVVNMDFLEVLQLLGNGKTLRDACTGIEEIVEAIREYPQESGELTLKIKLKPMKVGDPNCILAEANVTLKKPRKPAEPKVFFTTNRNTLVRNDPRQLEFLEGKYAEK